MNKKLFKQIDDIATEIPVTEIMTKNPVTLEENTTVRDGVQVMSKKNISGILVIDKEGKPVGIVSDGDIIDLVAGKKDLEKKKLKEIMTKDLMTIKPSVSIGEASVLMNKHNISKLPVMDKGKLVGYVAKGDLLEELNSIYYQNAKLKWMPLFMTILFIIIAVLLIYVVQLS